MNCIHLSQRTVIKPIKMTIADRNATKGTIFPKLVRDIAKIWSDESKRLRLIKYIKTL